MFNSLLAHSIGLLPKPIVKIASSPYIAGAKLDDAVRKIRELNAMNIRATSDVLGEFVNSKEQAITAKGHDMETLEAFAKYNLNSNLSIKLTSLGLNIDADFCYTNVKELVARAAELHNFVRIDMEDSGCTTATLDIYKRLRAAGFTNCGVVLQAYMRRSAADIDALPSDHLNVRLCKGIYIEPEAIAFKDREEVRRNYKLLLRKLMDKGAFVGIATHDEPLIVDAYSEIAQRKLTASSYEFQMLLGVRENRRAQTVRDGHPMRVYIPFGEDWYGYATRRLKENPQIAMNVVKSFFGIS